jgi:hypothetical protein
MKFIGFKESLAGFNDPKFNPPAMVRSVSRQNKHQQFVNWVIGGLKALLDFGKLREWGPTYADYAKRLEPYIFPGNCEHVCKFVKKHIPDYDFSNVPQKACGMIGCAYFLRSGHVLKCTLDKAEWTVAKALKGKKHLVPVIDTSYERKSGVYLILSEEIDMDSLSHISMDLDMIGDLIKEYLSDNKISKWKGTQKDLDNWFSLAGFRRFMLASFEADVYNEHQELANELFMLVVNIAKETGYILSGDLHSGNYGVSDDNSLRMIDFGFPRKLGKKKPLVGKWSRDIKNLPPKPGAPEPPGQQKDQEPAFM